MYKFCLLFTILIFLSCKYDITNPRPLPVINLNSPLDNQHYVKGDTVIIAGSVKNTVGLTEVAVHVTDLSTNNEFFHNHFSVSNKLEFAFESKYGIPDDKKANFKIEVEGLDRNGTSAIKDLTISLN